jgi:cobalt/nickel transport system permease protein
MNAQVPVHILSILWLIGPVGGLLVLMAVVWSVRRLRTHAQHEIHDEVENAWKKPDVDRYAGIRSPFHAWDPRVKIASLMLYVFCVGALTTLQWALVAVVTSLVAARVARMPLRFVAKRLMLVAGFLGMFFVVMPLTVRTLPGDALYAFQGVEFIHINPRGFGVAGLAFAKATAIVVMTIPLLGTSPFPVTIRALGNLKVPQILIQMILLSYRYLYVFASEMQRMATAMKARGFRARTDMHTLRTIGNFVGVLMVRSFERTERVYDAMLSRGYTGEVRKLDATRLRRQDIFMGAVWSGLGLLLVGLDRLATLADLWMAIGGS